MVNSLQHEEPLLLRGYHWSQEQLEETPENGIFYLALNMSSTCNYRCPYCFVGLDNLRSGPGELILKEKLKLTADAKELGAKVLVMPGRGEPMADKDFWPVVDYANNLGMWVVVYTNAYFVSEENIERLRDADISLYCKVDSLDPKVYEELVGKIGVFNKVKKNLELVLESFHSPVVEDGRKLSRLGINSVVTVKTESSIPEIYDWCKNNDVFYTCRSPVRVGEAEKTWDYLVQHKVNQLRETGLKYAGRNFTSATEKGQCGIYRFGVTVENTGDIYVCPDAREGFGSIGNIRKDSLECLIKRRNRLFPPNSSEGFCFVKSINNPEEVRSNGVELDWRNSNLVQRI